jgi:hypothetical protein
MISQRPNTTISEYTFLLFNLLGVIPKNAEHTVPTDYNVIALSQQHMFTAS